MKFTKSVNLQPKFNSLIPGGAHTYAKGDDQFPEGAPVYLVRGKGCHVWDIDGNEFIEYGMGLRAVSLGHAYEPVVAAAHRQMLLGSNFVRPGIIELECAEELLSIVTGAEMVKFGKNGSDVTSAAIRLSRAYTGRDLVAICEDHPFFSADDWFIGTTPVVAGIPNVIRELTVKFRYNSIESVESLFQKYPGKIACLIMEPEKEIEPADNFLHEVQRLCGINGAVFILDEMICGFRWHLGGAQQYHNIIPDLSTFGKAFGNGFSIAALAGKREIMRLGGLEHDKERVFLLSLTHGAEHHCLAAALEVMNIYKREPVIDSLWRQGERLVRGIKRSINAHNLTDFFLVSGRPCALGYTTLDSERRPSQPFRTLFLQETIKRGLLAPSLVVSYSHTDADIDRTIEVIHESLNVYRRALEEGVEKFLLGRPVKPVWRRCN
ncbi:MAG TPA: glutamate-1-semialdehyde 2,1-aminomutase [Nitrospiraceae bacterium]|nr:glutamate-1-semialdehyde 2,1-aminomutase [Nitrospiraceae bacterium]